MRYCNFSKFHLDECYRFLQDITRLFAMLRVFLLVFQTKLKFLPRLGEV